MHHIMQKKGQVRSRLYVKKTLTMMTSRETMPRSALASPLTSALNCGVVSKWQHSKTISQLANMWGAFLSKTFLKKGLQHDRDVLQLVKCRKNCGNYAKQSCKIVMGSLLKTLQK